MTVRLRAADKTFAPGGVYATVVGPPVGIIDPDVPFAYARGAFQTSKILAPRTTRLLMEHGGRSIGTCVAMRELRDRLWSVWRVDDPSWTWLLEERPQVSLTLAEGSRTRMEGGVQVVEDAVLMDASVVALWGGKWGPRCRVVEVSRVLDTAAPGRSQGVRQAADVPRMGWRDTAACGPVRAGRMPETTTASSERRAGSSTAPSGWRDTSPLGQILEVR